MLRLRNKNLLGFIFILIISFIPRFIMLFTQRVVNFEAEQGMDYLVARDIWVKHYFSLTGLRPLILWHMLPRIPGWYYLLSIPFVLGNGDPFWAKAMTGVISLITILIVFFVAKSIFNLKTALTMCILLSISPWLIEQTGQYWPPYIIILPVVIYFFATVKFFEKKQNYAILMALSIGFMVQFEVMTAIFCLVQTLLVMVFAIKYKYINSRTLLLSIFALFLALAPNILYDLTHKFYSLGGISLLTNDLSHDALNNIIKVFLQRIDVFTWNFRSVFSPNIIKSIFLFGIIYLGVYMYVKDKKNAYFKKLFVVYLALVPFVKFFLSFFYTSSIQAWYLLDLTILYCLLLGIILGYFLEKKGLRVLVIAVLVGLIIITSVRMSDIFRNEFKLSFGVSRIVQSAPVDYVFKDAKGKQFNYVSLDRGQNRYDFDYLFWWYGAKQYGYQPSIGKQRLTYYILDKSDANHETLPKDLTGKIINMKTFGNEYSVIKVIN